MNTVHREAVNTVHREAVCTSCGSAPTAPHSALCLWLEGERKNFRFGLWRHYKGGSYTAIALLIHHETRLPVVLYESHAYGGTNVRPLVGWPGDPDGWLDDVILPSSISGTERPLRYPRFEFVGELPSNEKVADRIARFEKSKNYKPIGYYQGKSPQEEK